MVCPVIQGVIQGIIMASGFYWAPLTPVGVLRNI